jgi:hypothetical protein
MGKTKDGAEVLAVLPSPYYPKIGDIFCVESICQSMTQVFINRWHYYVAQSTGSPGIEMGDIAASFANFLGPYFQGVLSNQNWFSGVRVYMAKVSPPFIYPMPVENYTKAVGGDSGANPCPGQDAPLISWYTDNSGPGGRGRTYHPTVSVDAIRGDGGINPSVKSWIGTLAAWLKLAAPIVVGANSLLGILSLYHRVGRSSSPIVGYTVHNRVATQRRRGDFGRTNIGPIDRPIPGEIAAHGGISIKPALSTARRGPTLKDMLEMK